MWSAGQDENEIIHTLLVPTALSRLELSLIASDAADAKALGTLAIDVAVVALLVATHSSLNHLWWLPAAALVSAGGFFIAVVWPRRHNFGPELEAARNELGSGTHLEASRQMLAELISAGAYNLAFPKLRLYKVGLVLMVVALLGCIPLPFS